LARSPARFGFITRRGDLYGIIGPNGAGKTTTLRMILSILMPDSGSITVLGENSALRAKDRIGYLPEERGVYRKMTVSAFLQHMALLKGVSREQVAPRVANWLERIGLADVSGKKCEELSKGMQQQIQFIVAVVHEPELLILDEPFSGLDPDNTVALRELIFEQRKRGTTVLLSTHVMHQAEQLCEHIVMIHDGRKVLDDPLSRIRERHVPKAIRFEPLEASGDTEAALRSVSGVASVERTEGFYRVNLADGVDPGRVLQAIVADVPPSRVELIRPSLEDVFVELAERRPAGAGAGLYDRAAQPIAAGVS
jgi:ABC-2 type transport system ATP-binding protein